jgi:predicted metal-dependent HD superfamily phosphohydrolase
MQYDFLLQKFKQLADNQLVASDLFYKNIVTNYTKNGRFYHNLSHINALLQPLENIAFYQAITETLETPSASLQYAIFYHDIIYKPLQNDNEEASAEFAKNDMKQLNMAQKVIDTTAEMIILTKTHTLTHENDTPEARLLLDLDLAILGESEAVYERYAENIRQEYWLIPEKMYRKGRTKVLLHFIDSQNIYKTPYFQTHFEAQAKANLTMELRRLGTRPS